MAAENCIWSRVQKYAFFLKIFLKFSQYCGFFQEKLFYLIQNGGWYRDGVLVILQSPFFQKIRYNQRLIQKKNFNGLQAEKFIMAPKIKMATNLEFL
jgi:hypothetical protein